MTHDDNEKNLQALCKMCHSVKTKRFMMKHIGNINDINNIDYVSDINDIDYIDDVSDIDYIDDTGDINDIDIECNNKIIVNNNILSPFGQEEIDKLTIKDKILILTSNINPLIMLVLKTNLDPSKSKYHNIGYTDLKSSFSIIFHNKMWSKKGFNSIMNVYLHLKYKDLLKIYNEIGEYLRVNVNKKIINTRNIIEAKTEFYAKLKKKLILTLKIHFYNNCHLVKNARKKINYFCVRLLNKSIFSNDINNNYDIIIL